MTGELFVKRRAWSARRPTIRRHTGDQHDLVSAENQLAREIARPHTGHVGRVRVRIVDEHQPHQAAALRA